MKQLGADPLLNHDKLQLTDPHGETGRNGREIRVFAKCRKHSAQSRGVDTIEQICLIWPTRGIANVSALSLENSMEVQRGAIQRVVFRDCIDKDDDDN